MHPHKYVLLTLAAQAIAHPLNARDDDGVAILPLTRLKSDATISSRYLRYGFRARKTQLKSTGVSFLADISFGSQTFQSVIDTGSADTWLARNDFTCITVIGNMTQPPSQCAFGKTYTPNSEFKPIPNENFNITYGDGEYLNGVFGNVPVTLANIKLAKQRVALATVAAWRGDGVTSGIIGLAYPALTAAYSGSDVRQDSYCLPNRRHCHQIVYSSIINTIFNTTRTSQVFSMALSRDTAGTGQGGVLAIGGSPDITAPTVNASSTAASTPIQYLPMDNAFRYYLILVDGLNYGSKQQPNSGGSYIVDSGTTLNFFPSAQTANVNQQFNPPARYDQNTGFWFVQCNAKPPTLGVVISGQTFYHNGLDLIKPFSPGRCISGIQDGGALGIAILGDVFLDNVLAIFDVGASQMRFQARPYYQS